MELHNYEVLSPLELYMVKQKLKGLTYHVVFDDEK